LLVPPVIASTATAFLVEELWAQGGVIVASVFTCLMLRPIERYGYLIRERRHERGGPLNFSMWLLYWTYIFRHLSFSLVSLCLIFSSVPKWRNSMLLAAGLSSVVSAGFFLLRFIGLLVDKKLVRVGVRLGFSDQPSDPREWKIPPQPIGPAPHRSTELHEVAAFLIVLVTNAIAAHLRLDGSFRATAEPETRTPSHAEAHIEAQDWILGALKTFEEKQGGPLGTVLAELRGAIRENVSASRGSK
jgi:hypothetical protein